MSSYRMFLPMKPDGTIMEMFPLRNPESALVAAARFMPRSMSAEELRSSEELAPSCWRAAGGGWGFSDALALEIAKAHRYSTVEVFLQAAQPVRLEKVPVDAIRRVIERSTWPAIDAMTHSAIEEVRRWLEKGKGEGRG